MDPGRGPIRAAALAALVSTAGSTAANIAIAVYIYLRTGSAVWLSVSLLLTFGVTGFLTPFTGIIADRFDRRRLIVATELGAGVIYVGMVFIESPALIVLLGFLEALIAMPSGSALRAAVPSIAGAETSRGRMASSAWGSTLGMRSVLLSVEPSLRRSESTPSFG